MVKIGLHLRKLSQIKTGVSLFWTTLYTDIQIRDGVTNAVRTLRIYSL